jgi:ferric-dicitrate binding protein FerR (iron transport regulator)
VVLSGGLALYVNNRPVEQSPPKPATASMQHVKACTGCATLTLANGAVINLDSAGNGNLAVQGGTRILKMDAGVTYQAGQNKGNVSYNTISTPKGGMYQVSLPDGTRVWLNAASSIRFPTAFTGHERRVEAKGEVFFEVSANARLPFIVSARESEIRVLGTSFNVNAYEDDEEVKTTLLTGSVKVAVSSRSEILKPGEQLWYNAQLKKALVRKVNVEDVMAWKEGFFHFDNADVQTIMRQISRWYNVEVVYEGTIPARGFKGEIGRDLSLGDVINFLKKLKVNVNLEENKLVVRP